MKRRSEIPSSSSKQPVKSWSNCMNGLCSDLTSLIPPQHLQNSKDVLSQSDQIEQATSYIVELKERVANLDKRKEQLQMMMANQNTTWNYDATMANSSLPIIEVNELGSNLKVQLVVDLENDIMLHDVIRVLEEEGAEVVNANYSTSGNKVYHTLHAKARSSRVRVETSRVRDRLQEFI